MIQHQDTASSPFSRKISISSDSPPLAANAPLWKPPHRTGRESFLARTIRSSPNESCRRLKCRLVVALVLTCALSNPCLLEAQQGQQAATFESKTYRFTFQRGVLVSAANNLTGEVYSSGTPAADGTGLVWLKGNPIDARSARSCDARRTPGGAEFELRWDEGRSLRTQVGVDAATGDLIIRQKGSTGKGGLYGCAWAVTGLSDDAVEVILPATSGIRLGKGAPIQSRLFNWPAIWEAQLVIVQGRKGGFCVWAEDDRFTFKGIRVRYEQGRFALELRTYNEGPLAERREVESVKWHINCYRGDWRVPAGRYRDWMERTYRLVPLRRQRPGWVKDIAFVVTLGGGRTPEHMEKQKEVLRELARLVEPRKTLLYTPDWRRDTYDRNYPDYTACEGFRGLVDAAHRLGFRVMAHTNYVGCCPENPRCEELKPFWMHSLRTGEPLIWKWRWANPPKLIYFIHPGSSEWRRLFTARCRDIVRNCGVDAIHLDVSLCIPNARDCRVDGMNPAAGNVQLHRDLRSALPDVALGGEGLNEVTCRQEAFAQTHGLFGIFRPADQPGRVFYDDRIDCGHPISAFLFHRYTAWYGYLGYPEPTSRPLYRAWTRQYENWGVLPTLSRPSVEKLRAPGPDLGVKLREARLVTTHDLRPDFESPTGRNVKCVWRGEDGSRLVYEKDEFGGSHAYFQDAAGVRETIYRYLRGRTFFKGSGSIRRWLAWDEEGLYGLDPAVTYLYLPQPRKSEGPRLGYLPPDAILDRVRWDESKMVFSLRHATETISLPALLARARTGILVDDREEPVGRGAVVSRSRSTCGRLNKDSLFAHPPWMEGQGVIGTAFAEWKLHLPKDKQAVLKFDLGLRDGAERNEGVRFVVQADGRTIFDEVTRDCTWKPRSVDVSNHAGRDVRLRFLTTRAPDGTGSFAWAAWGEPLIELRSPPRRIELEALLPAKPVSQFGAAAVADRGRDGELYRCRTTVALPGTACFLFRQAVKVSLPLDLLAQKFTWTSTVRGMPLKPEERPPYLGASPGEGKSAGETRKALITHPPQYGRTWIDYYLALPAAKARFECAVAIQDGAKTTNGIVFIVLVNGEEARRLTVEEPDGWHNLAVDLSAHSGKPVLLTLCVDSNGLATCDWARWGEPRIVPLLTAE